MKWTQALLVKYKMDRFIHAVELFYYTNIY